jgi:transposase
MIARSAVIERKTLTAREHLMYNCGFVAHRDRNSALTIKGRAGLSGMVPDGASREP